MAWQFEFDLRVAGLETRGQAEWPCGLDELCLLLVVGVFSETGVAVFSLFPVGFVNGLVVFFLFFVLLGCFLVARIAL